MAPFAVPCFNKNKPKTTSEPELEHVEPPRRARPQTIDQRVPVNGTGFDQNRTAPMPNQAARQSSARTQTLDEMFPGDGYDHSRDDDMGCLGYWHFKITRFNPQVYYIPGPDDAEQARDGKHRTMMFSREKKRQMQSYKRRQSEKKAAKAAVKAEQKHQRWVDEGRSENDYIEATPKLQKMTDLLKSSHKADSTHMTLSKSAEEKLDLANKRKAEEQLRAKEKLEAKEQLEANEQLDAEEQVRSKEDLNARKRPNFKEEFPDVPTHTPRRTATEATQYYEAHTEPEGLANP